ncbi:hypothetical protein JHK87_025881 [Glycine soja]|nr:hypothetical protein JHK87_025881 [Glycine soja]
MYGGVPVACRTRSKRKIESVSGASLKRERVSERGFDCLGGHARDPIEISDSEAEEGIRHSEKKRFLVQKESKREEGKGCPVFVDKVENFGNDDYSCVPENRGEDCATTGEDFQVDYGESDCYSSSEDSDSSYDDDDDDDDDEDERGGYSKTVKERNDSVKDDSNWLEEKDDDVGQGQTQPLVSRETDSLNWNFMKKEPSNFVIATFSPSIFSLVNLSREEELINEVDWSGNQKQNKDAIRMVKLFSWYKEKSILLISYNLYEKLAGATSEGDGKKEKKNSKMKKKRRNVQGQGSTLKVEWERFCVTILERKDVSWDWEPDSSGDTADEKINQLKLLMNPFVHVHKGNILQKNLPGLRDCVLVLKPDILQQETLESIECSQIALNFEHKLAWVSVHPSLFLNCSLSKKEESVVHKDKLEKLRLNPYGGDQLESAINWSVGMEVLYMYGKLDQKQKQSLIQCFNDSNSQAKVLLASIKASSDGINLIGASRVMLLDVVWNPSVERQAICRAYRLGQKRVVFTYHLLAQGTPECTKYCKQAEKNRLSELVFSNRNAESDKLKSSGVRFEDRVLDLMVQHKKLKDMFGECLVQPRERYLETLGP